MKSNFALTAPFYALALLISQANGYGQAIPTHKQRFLSEAPPSWVSLMSDARRIQGGHTTLLTVETERPKNVRKQRFHSEVKQAPDCSLQINQISNATKNEGVAFVFNSKYAFELGRKGEGGPWVLRNVDLQLKDGRSAVLRRGVGDVVFSACDHLTIRDRFVPEMVKESGFSLKKVHSVDRDGSQLIKVEFAYEPEKKDWNYPARGGWMVLDPDNNWVIREYDVEALWPDGKGTLVGSYVYERSKGGFPVMKRFVETQKVVSSEFGRVSAQRVREYTFCESSNVAENEFTLTAFGLPEPKGIVWPSSTRWYLWITLAAFAAMTLVFVFRRLQARFQNRQKAAPNHQ